MFLGTIRTVLSLYSVGFEYHTFPDDHGVTIVTGVSDIKTSRYFEDTYEWFDKNKRIYQAAFHKDSNMFPNIQTLFVKFLLCFGS